MKINREWYLNKVRACWIGKNIGGTMGAPYEASTEMQDISGFNSPKGEPIANDDLDLQLIWMCAVEERGIQNVTPEVLGEYWITFIPPYWNEYGIGKTNMKLGIRPPYSGEYQNEIWKNSNGAWIRTEIWACLFPGYPELASRYAYNDACVDHGLGEGTFAAMFVAALESYAFIESDIRKLIAKGLTFIPENCRVARSVRLAMELYDNKVDFKDARQAIVDDSADLGWFQAPANVAFVMLGLLYGEGDYKKSMIYTINCGDDTDCTGATVGSIMGLIGGCDYVPQDWAEYIGDSIVSIAIDLSYLRRPKSCTELTRRVYELVPSVLKAYGVFAEYTDGETEWEPIPETFQIFQGFNLEAEGFDPRPNDLRTAGFDVPNTGLSLNFPDLIFAKARVEFDKYQVKAGDKITLKLIAKNTMTAPGELRFKIELPEGWTVDRQEPSLYLHEMRWKLRNETEVTITVGEQVYAHNTVRIVASAPGRITTAMLPIIFAG